MLFASYGSDAVEQLLERGFGDYLALWERILKVLQHLRPVYY